MKKLTICAAMLMLTVACGDDPADPVDGGRTDSGGGAVDSGPDDEDSGTDTDSGTGTDAGSDSGTAEDPDCETYCTTNLASCTGDNAQYADMASCLSVCGSIPLGTAADTTGNTVGCRTYHSGAAAADPATHCPHAGPAGAGACGTNCESFCTIALDACATAFDDLADCMDQCDGYPEEPAYSLTTTGGDSYACRLYHLTVATSVPTPHCTHIDEASPPCN